MKFVLFIGSAPDAESYDPALDNIDEWVSDLDARGVRLIGDRLVSESESLIVRKRGGEVLVTDGPFSEAKEHIGGFWIVEAPDLDAALKLAERGSTACRAPVEVRPFHDGPPEADEA